jgi:hypothetical protein
VSLDGQNVSWERASKQASKHRGVSKKDSLVPVLCHTLHLSARKPSKVCQGGREGGLFYIIVRLYLGDWHSPNKNKSRVLRQRGGARKCRSPANERTRIASHRIASRDEVTNRRLRTFRPTHTTRCDIYPYVRNVCALAAMAANTSPRSTRTYRGYKVNSPNGLSKQAN